MSEAVIEFPEIRATPFTVHEPGTLTPVEYEEPDVSGGEAGDLVEWTPERAASIVRGFGYLLHSVDPVGGMPGGEELWRATSQEAQEIGAPLSRILARYEPAKRLAGVVDEAELGAAFVGYAKRNMSTRGRVVLAAKSDDDGGGFSSGPGD